MRGDTWVILIIVVFSSYVLGDHPIADELRSLDIGDKAVQYIYAPRLQSLLYPGEKRLPR